MPFTPSEAQWRTLRKLYDAGYRGIPGSPSGYPTAGTWDVLEALRALNPPLITEAYDTRKGFGSRPVVVITLAGIRFYEKHQRLYNALYPLQDAAPGAD